MTGPRLTLNMRNEQHLHRQGHPRHHHHLVIRIGLPPTALWEATLAELWSRNHHALRGPVCKMSPQRAESLVLPCENLGSAV